MAHSDQLAVAREQRARIAALGRDVDSLVAGSELEPWLSRSETGAGASVPAHRGTLELVVVAGAVGEADLLAVVKERRPRQGEQDGGGAAQLAGVFLQL